MNVEEEDCAQNENPPKEMWRENEDVDDETKTKNEAEEIKEEEKKNEKLIILYW